MPLFFTPTTHTHTHTHTHTQARDAADIVRSVHSAAERAAQLYFTDTDEEKEEEEEEQGELV